MQSNRDNNSVIDDNISVNSSNVSSYNVSTNASFNFNHNNIGDTDENGNTYNDYKEYFEIANLDPKNNFKSKACKKAYEAYNKVEEKNGKIRKEYEKKLNEAEKAYKKVEKKLREQYKDKGYEFFKRPDGGFYELPEVSEHINRIEEIRNEMNAKLKVNENKFLGAINKKKDKEGNVVDVMKRNDTKLFLEAQDKGLSNPEKYTIRERRNNMNNNKDLKELLSQFVKEEPGEKKQSLWEKIKDAIKVYLFGEEKKNKKDSIVEQVINKIKDWLSGNDKKNKSGEQLYSITMEKLITDISEKKVEKRIENEFTISKDSFRTQSQFDEKFNKIVNKHNNIDPIKLNKNKEEQMEEKGNIEKDQRIKGALDENKEYIFEENKDRSTVNSLENNKVTSTVNPEKLNKNKEEQMEEKGNIEKDQRIKEALEEGKEHSGGVVNNNINKENGKTVINDEDYNADDLDEFKNVETKNDNSLKNNNLNIDIKQQTQSGPSSPSAKISFQKVPQKSGVQSNQI